MSQPLFSDDNPKENPWTEDRLGFTPFAKRLADSISEIDAPNGYVIGLQGAWGSGKSTALNFVQAIIKKRNDELEEGRKPIHVIDFRPWIVSGHQDLIESFFKIITEQLANQKDAWSKRGKAGLRVLRKNVDPVVDAAAAIGSILAPGIGTLGSIGVKFASEAAKKSGASKLEEWLAEPSLQSSYDKLHSRIAEQDEKFLVIIDDIDRLTKDEIRSIMQMVKTLGRLPNVVYLLAYDRKIVWPALDGANSRDDGGPSFAEKIIQQEVELPKPGRNDLLSMLDAEIGFLTSNTPQDLRWYHIVSDGVQRWIKYPRDVARLSNAIKFTWPAIQGEVDPQDILAIEGLRLFEPAVFGWIRDNRENMFGSGNWALTTDQGRAKISDEFLASIPKSNHEAAVRLLCALLPSASKIFEKRSFYGLSHEPHYKTVNRRGIGSEAGYDTYFRLHPSPEAVSKATLDKALNTTTTVDEQLNIMRSLFENIADPSKPLLGEYFQDLRYRLHDSPRTTAPTTLFEALFYFGEQIHSIERDVGAFILSPGTNAAFLLAEICKSLPSSEKSAVLSRIFDENVSLTFLAEFWIWRAGELGLVDREGRTEEPTIGEPLLRELHGKLVYRIEKSVEDGSIYKLPYYFYIAQVWAFDGNNERVKEWISNRSLIDAHFLAKICRGILGYTVGSKPRVYSMNEHPREDYLDLVRLHQASERHANDVELSDDERSRIVTLRDGLARIIAARSGEESSAEAGPGEPDNTHN